MLTAWSQQPRRYHKGVPSSSAPGNCHTGVPLTPNHSHHDPVDLRRAGQGEKGKVNLKEGEWSRSMGLEVQGSCPGPLVS